MNRYLRPNQAKASGTQRLVRIALTVLSSMAVYGQAAAQVTPPIGDPPINLEPPPTAYPPTVAPSAAGPYFASPAWGQTLAPNVRFVILTNFSSDAVLDRETGLVWARRNAFFSTLPAVFPPSLTHSWDFAALGCRSLVVGNRGGWRLPTVAELQTLVDFSLSSSPGFLKLPTGHPFSLDLPPLIGSFRHFYWTSDEIGGNASMTVNLEFGSAAGFSKTDLAGVLCVRGRQ